MILLISLILTAILLPVVTIFTKGTLQKILTAIVGVLFSGAIILVIMNQSNHLGMEKVTETKTLVLESSSSESPVNMLLYKPLGNGEEKVYVYHTDKQESKPKITGQDKTTNKVVLGDSEAHLEVTTTNWEYRSSFLENIFSVDKNAKILVNEENTFYLPNDWIELSTDEAETLSENLKKNEAQMKIDAQTYISEKIKEAMVKNPELSQEEIKKLTEKLTKEFQLKAVQDLLK